MYEQKQTIINEVQVPYIINEGVEYYPANFILTKVLGRNANTKDINRDYLLEYIKSFKVDYGYDTGGIQNVKCMSKDGFILYLDKSKLGKLNENQRKAMNELYKHLGVDKKINDNEFLSKKVITRYTQDCINEVLEINPNIEFQHCSKCGNKYPIHKNFFSVDKRAVNGYSCKCKECLGNIMISENKVYNDIYTYFKDEGYELYIKDKCEFYIKFIYEEEIDKAFRRRLNESLGRECFLKIINILYKNKKLLTEEISSDYIVNTLNINMQKMNLHMKNIYDCLFGNDYIYYPWKYPNNIKFDKKDLSIKDMKIMFSNYIQENNISENDLLELDYWKLICEFKLTSMVNDTLEFAVTMNNFKYAGYMFKTVGQNYYKKRENRVFDMKYLIEQDLKLETDKIPLYLTKSTIANKTRSLQNVLLSKKYYKNMFEYINDCYPNKFTQLDFDLSYFKEEFDSDEEMQVNGVIREYFDNVIYNQRNTQRTISIQDMQPDWLLFTSNDCYLVEYFGFYVNRKSSEYNSRIERYINKTHTKLDKYNSMTGYKFLGIYPEDLTNNYKGLREKLINIKNEEFNK